MVTMCVCVCVWQVEAAQDVGVSYVVYPCSELVRRHESVYTTIVDLCFCSSARVTCTSRSPRLKSSVSTEMLPASRAETAGSPPAYGTRLDQCAKLAASMAA